MYTSFTILTLYVASKYAHFPPKDSLFVVPLYPKLTAVQMYLSVNFEEKPHAYHWVLVLLLQAN